MKVGDEFVCVGQRKVSVSQRPDFCRGWIDNNLYLCYSGVLRNETAKEMA